jgi:hypothetical protein
MSTNGAIPKVPNVVVPPAVQPNGQNPNDYSNQQFNETRELPFTYRSWNSAEIEEFRRALVRSYTGCDEKDITFNFEPVDKDDPDKDCIWLVYKMSCIWGSEPITRTIYSKKMQLPERLRAKAEELLKTSNPVGGSAQTFKGTYDDSDSKWKPPSFNFRNVIKKNTATPPPDSKNAASTDAIIIENNIRNMKAVEYNAASKLSVEDVEVKTIAPTSGPKVEEVDDEVKVQPESSSNVDDTAAPKPVVKPSRVKRPVKAKK